MAAMAILTLFLFLWEYVHDPFDLVLDTRLLFSRLDMGGVCMLCFFFFLAFQPLILILPYTTFLCIYSQCNLTSIFIHSCYPSLLRLELDKYF
jgi:hypothetical protein